MLRSHTTHLTLAVAVAVAVSAMSGPAQAGDDPPPRLADEIRWARATWPGDLRAVRFSSILPKLLEWVPPGGEIETFFFAPRHECTRVLLSRPRSEPGVLVGKIILREQLRRKQPARSCGSFAVSEGGALNVATGGSRDVQLPDGRWVEISAWGVGDGGTDVGFLSYVDDDVARFAGEPLRIEAFCSGPWEWLPCDGGGERPCVRCEEVSLVAVERNGAVGFSVLPPREREATCSDSCPYTTSPALARMKALADRVNPWRRIPLPPTATPSLHRSREACLAAHHVSARQE